MSGGGWGGEVAGSQELKATQGVEVGKDFLSVQSAGDAVGIRNAGGKGGTRTCRERRRFAEFQWFLTALSVRPCKYLAISAHLLPNWRIAGQQHEARSRREARVQRGGARGSMWRARVAGSAARRAQ